jgi:hypothetical protein
MKVKKYINEGWVCGIVVVKALCYELEVAGSRPYEVYF